MKISVEKIFQFHRLRTQTHIDCLNYYAGLLGYHFPEHDNDKNHDTICARLSNDPLMVIIQVLDLQNELFSK